MLTRLSRIDESTFAAVRCKNTRLLPAHVARQTLRAASYLAGPLLMQFSSAQHTCVVLSCVTFFWCVDRNHKSSWTCSWLLLNKERPRISRPQTNVGSTRKCSDGLVLVLNADISLLLRALNVFAFFCVPTDRRSRCTILHALTLPPTSSNCNVVSHCVCAEQLCYLQILRSRFVPPIL
jgi:hypothetical protein